MTNLRIISDNAADRATLTASSTAGSLGVSNLQSDVKSQPWRATSTAARIGITWTTSELIGGMFLPFCNLSPTATARVRASNEASATNLLKYSERFSDASWQRGNCTIIPNAIAAPDGSMTADAVVRTAAGNHYMFQNLTSLVAANNTFTFSGWLLTGTYTNLIRFWLKDSAGVSLVANNVQPSGVWTRFSVTGTFPSTATGYPCIYIDPSLDAGGAGDVFYIWGAMLVAGPDLTSYYPSLDTFTSRASVGRYVDSAGVLQSAAINVARTSYNPTNLSAPPSLLLEAAATNGVRNNTMAGAVAGSPGTMPNYWGYGNNSSGLAWSVIGTGAESGINYIDLRLSGTSTGVSESFLFPEVGSTAIAAVSGQQWTGSAFIRRGAGTNTNVNSVVLRLEPLTSGGGGLAQISGVNLLSTLGAANIAINRVQQSVTLADATTAYLRPLIIVGHGVGAVDITLRIGMPQLELGAFATSPIATTSAAVTRSADISTSAPGVRPTGYIDSWQSYDYDSGAVLACPAAAVKLRGFTPAQAASAYAYGGGACARHWLPAPMQALGMAIDIVDSANAQGYVEAARLVVGAYWSPANNADYGASMTIQDASKHYRTDGGDLLTDVGTRARKMPLQLSAMPPADRTALLNIMRSNGMAGPMLISLFPGDSDLELERDHTIYGKLSSVSAMAIPYFSRYSAPLEIEEI